MDLQLRTIEESEKTAFARSAVIPFLELGVSDAAHHWSAFLEPERTWVVVDGDRFVANCCVFSRRLALPGAGDPSVAASGPQLPASGPQVPASGSQVPVAAVSGVGVHPTHRRQGLLGRMMTAMLSDARARHEPMAALLASEASIYGRFGFGLATSGAAVAVHTRRSAFSAPTVALPLILMESDEAAKVVPALFDRLVAGRPGQVNRDEATWADIFEDPTEHRNGATALYWAVGEDGYVSWRVKGTTLSLRDLYGATPEVEAALWRFVLDVDLIDEVVAPHRPVDEAVRWRMADPRQWRTIGLGDFLWVRILDVPAALGSRRYEVADRLVLDVAPPASGTGQPDPVTGRFVLDAGPDGSTCTPAPAGTAADLRLGLTDLGSLLLGGVGASTLAAAGRVVEERPGAAAAADRLFTTSTAPFTGTSF
jgi:predicted acetyltransferase